MRALKCQLSLTNYNLYSSEASTSSTWIVCTSCVVLCVHRDHWAGEVWWQWHWWRCVSSVCGRPVSHWTDQWTDVELSGTSDGGKLGRDTSDETDIWRVSWPHLQAQRRQVRVSVVVMWAGYHCQIFSRIELENRHFLPVYSDCVP